MHAQLHTCHIDICSAGKANQSAHTRTVLDKFARIGMQLLGDQPDKVLCAAGFSRVTASWQHMSCMLHLAAKVAMHLYRLLVLLRCTVE